MAQDTFIRGVKSRVVVEFFVGTDRRRVIMTILAAACTSAAAVEGETFATAGTRCHQRRVIGWDVMAIVIVTNDAAVTTCAMTILGVLRGMMGRGPSQGRNSCRVTTKAERLLLVAKPNVGHRDALVDRWRGDIGRCWQSNCQGYGCESQTSKMVE